MKKLNINKKLKLVPLMIFLFIGGVALGAILYSNVITQQITLHSIETRMTLTLEVEPDLDVYNADIVTAVIGLELIDTDFKDTPFVFAIYFNHTDTRPSVANGDIELHVDVINSTDDLLWEADIGGEGTSWLQHSDFGVVCDPAVFSTNPMAPETTINDEFQGSVMLYFELTWFFGYNCEVGNYDMVIQIEEP